MDYTARIKLKSGKYFIMHCGLLSIMKTNCKLKDVTEELGTMLILISIKEFKIYWMYQALRIISF